MTEIYLIKRYPALFDWLIEDRNETGLWNFTVNYRIDRGWYLRWYDLSWR